MYGRRAESFSEICKLFIGPEIVSRTHTKEILKKSLRLLFMNYQKLSIHLTKGDLWKGVFFSCQITAIPAIVYLLHASISGQAQGGDRLSCARQGRRCSNIGDSGGVFTDGYVVKK